ncbi:MAG: 2-dehydro-3-deoxy-D-gluconate 5-dehydrogenase KduD [Terriglobia bacterium]|nr:2-dehydro-3-deoxy-D-gluconate 5-dehydrogenase KduD [Terriglobia bacterium]
MAILDLFSLQGKNALVTGSSQGLGAGMAIAFAQAGANVTLHGFDEVLQSTVEEVQQTGVRSISMTGDVCDPEVCARLVDETVSAFGSIDILVNNAGTIRRAPAAEHSPESWSTVIETNLNSVFRLSQYAGRKMLAQGSGKIINIASMLTFQGGILVPSYAAAKGAVGQLTKALANEWASRGVNVNAIAPGYMATDNTAPLRADAERSKTILARIPAGRWGLPSDLAGAAVFLASAASNYVHGHILVVDGGWLCR